MELVKKMAGTTICFYDFNLFQEATEKLTHTYEYWLFSS